MAITYPIDFPTVLGMANFELGLRSAVARTESPFSLTEQVVKYTGERWEANVTMPNMLREYAEDFNAFILQLRGRYGTFLLGDPNAATPRGSWAGTPVVDGINQTGDELDIRGLTPSATEIAKAGDFIQLGTGSSSYLHKVLEDADADGSGKTTLLLAPNLRTNPADGATVTTTNCKGVFRLAQNYVPYSINDESIYNLSFRCVEVL